MIFYNSLLAKWFLGKGKKHYFMLWLVFLYPAINIWKSGKIWNSNSCQTVLGMFFFNPDTSTYFIVTAFMVVDGVTIRDLSHTLWFEKIICHHSIFNWEAMKHCGDTLYLRKRKAYAWKKGYGKKELPASRWND